MEKMIAIFGSECSHIQFAMSRFLPYAARLRIASSIKSDRCAQETVRGEV
jgi:hypothetical protein